MFYPKDSTMFEDFMKILKIQRGPNRKCNLKGKQQELIENEDARKNRAGHVCPLWDELPGMF